MRSAPLSLQTARKGGSLTSSIGASNNGKSGNCILSILTMNQVSWPPADVWINNFLHGIGQLFLNLQIY